MAFKSILNLFAFIVLLGIVREIESTQDHILQEFVTIAFHQVNELRTKYGLNTLKLDDKLTEGAQNWAESEANNDELNHSCGPCNDYSEILAEKITNSPVPVPQGQEAVDWALGRWFGDLIQDREPTKETAKAYANLLKKPNLIAFGIGIAYGKTSEGDNTVFAVARFYRSSKSKKHG